MKEWKLPLISIIINFLLVAILESVFGSNIESLIMIGTLVLCANLWAVAQYIKSEKI